MFCPNFPDFSNSTMICVVIGVSVSDVFVCILVFVELQRRRQHCEDR